MPIDIQAALEGGYEKTVARTGLQFAAVFFLLSVLNTLVSPERETLPLGETPAGEVAPAGGVGPTAPTLGLPPTVGGLLSLLVTVVTVVVTIAALRTLVAGETESVPGEHYTRNLAWAAVNLVIGGVAFAIVVGIGLILLVVPGLFLLVSLVLWEVFVAVEDENFVEGFRHSWDLTSGHRLRLFGLGVVVAVVALLVSAALSIPAFFLPDLLGFLIEEVGSALLGVFFLAAIAAAYNQLVAMDDQEPGPETTEFR